MAATSRQLPRPEAPSRQWRRAWRALRQLVADTRRTDLVFEILDALSGPDDAALTQRFRAEPEGARLLAARPDLLAALSDRSALAALPEGTLGRAYADFMGRGELSPRALLEADHPGNADGPGTTAQEAEDLWVGARVRDAHDLWHVVTGYGMDEAGEAALLAFSYAQLGHLGLAFIAVAAAWLGPLDWRLTWQRYLLRAWRRGRRARPLAAVPWERWMRRPLACVRHDLRIERPEVAHPGGILVASTRGELRQGELFAWNG